MRKPMWKYASVAALLLACAVTHAAEAATGSNKPDASGRSHGHSHAAPHGGTLVSLGGCFAHVEFVVDSTAGRLTAYILDGNAERGVRVAQPELEASLSVEDPKPASESTATLVLKLVAQTSVLTGEKPGDASEFAATADALKGARRVSGRLGPLSIKGQKFDGVEFQWPSQDKSHGHGAQPGKKVKNRR
ncbi:MAG: hypothetical protein N2111_03280 [Candidatus Sumerlaeaceae bacterium]|nr:hypothetical protein [Candidatus Sumerlaeaceae bacterium]